MAGGRYWLEFDPYGYKRVQEPGMEFLYYGSTLFEYFDSDHKDMLKNTSDFLNPPGSQWIMCKPRQMSPSWVSDPRLGQNVLPLSKWHFSSGLNPVEWEPTALPNGPQYPDNRWISIATVPDGTAPQDLCDFNAIAEACGNISLLPSTKTIGWCGDTPAGRNFMTLENYYTPQFNWIQYPPPYDQFIFGFAQFAFVCRADVFYVLESPGNSKQEWKLLWEGGINKRQVEYYRASGGVMSTGGTGVARLKADIRSLMIVPGGVNEFHIYPSGADPVSFEVRPAPKPDDSYGWFSPGPFWVAAAKNQRVNFQAQIVGYETADSRNIVPTVAPFFDLGEYYKPSVAPTFWEDYVLYTTDPEHISPTRVADTVSGDVVITDTSGVGNKIEYGLITEKGLQWDFVDAADYRGKLWLRLTPGDLNIDEAHGRADEGAFLSPQIRLIEGSFPTILVDREFNPIQLDDTQFSSIEASVSWQQPDGKKISIDLFDAGLKVLSESGHDRRAEYPIHILQDTDGDNEPDAIRVAGWISAFDIEEVIVSHPVTGERVLVYRIEAQGLTQQVNQKFEFLPQLVDSNSPELGKIEHTVAVKKAFKMGGIDADNDQYLWVQQDRFTGTDMAQIPNTWGLVPGVLGQPNPKNVWAPGWDDTILDWCVQTGNDMRNWIIYETFGRRIYYTDDLMLDLERGASYEVAATLYKSHVSAGPLPKQTWAPGGNDYLIEPEGNVVRIGGDDESTLITPWVMQRDVLSITDPTYPHFLGASKIYAPPPTKKEKKLEDMKILCQLLLERVSKRRHVKNRLTNVAPWDTLPKATDVGLVLALEDGPKGVIIFAQWELLRSRSAAEGGPIEKTRFTIMELPEGATQGAGAGDYPGHAQPLPEAES